MDDFGDRMMEFLFDRDAADQPTAGDFLAALKAFPDEGREVRHYFMIWVWDGWCQAHLPPPPEPSQEELDEFAERSLQRFRDMLRMSRH